MNKSKMTFNISGLTNIKKSLSDKFYIDIGILGSDANLKHGKSELTNAEIGAIHEFGSLSRNIPRRSFLYDPITDDLPDFLKEKRTSELYAETAKNNEVKKWWGMLSRRCYRWVDNAFKTGFKGNWADIKRETANRRRGGGNVQQFPLVDTGQLRGSITAVVKRGKK